MNKFDFDEIIHKPFEEEVIEYGIIKGNKTVFFTKAGANGSMRGYEDKYLVMGVQLHNKYGYTVVCSSNPFAHSESIGQGMEIVEQFVQKPYQVYYFGHSNGAVMGARHAWKYPQIKRLALVNGPLMLNWHHTRDGAQKFQGEKMVFIYGDRDMSYKYVPMLSLIDNPLVSAHTIPGADHQFVGKLQEFEELPEQYLVK